MNSTTVFNSSRYKILLLMIYAFFIGIVLWRHEMWRDELQAWGIVASSDSFEALIQNIRYEGHPLLWFLMIWPIAKVFDSVVAMQVLQFILTLVLGCTVIFKSPFKMAGKVGLLFSYFFLFEYTAISRNYLIGAILIYWICIQWKDPQKNALRISLLLFLLFQTNTFAFLIGIGISAALLLEIYSQGLRWQDYLTYLGIVIILPAGVVLVSLATPPPDGTYAPGWFLKWDASEIIRASSSFLHGILPSIKPKAYNFWNANVLDESWMASLISLFLFSTLAFLLRKNKSALVIFVVSILLILFFVYTKQIGAMRHKGHFFLGLTAALWVYYIQKLDTNRRSENTLTYLIGAILSVQVLTGFTALYKDVRYPFSQSENTAAYIRKNLPENIRVAGAFQELLIPLRWYLQRPVYFLDIEREQPFVVWNNKNWNETLFMQPDSVTYVRFAEYQKKFGQAVLVMAYHTPHNEVKEGYSDTLNLAGGRYRIHCFKAFDQAIERQESYFLFNMEEIR
jgi:hypothetical protein